MNYARIEDMKQIAVLRDRRRELIETLAVLEEELFELNRELQEIETPGSMADAPQHKMPFLVKGNRVAIQKD